MSLLPRIAICICTCERPQLLARLLGALEHQRTENRFDYSVVVTDNDPAQSARTTVESFARESRWPVIYATEPRRNIALARNEALRHANGDFIAFIDDDEFPVDDWLLQMLTNCEEYDAAGVLGPVRPHFETSPPAWVIRGGFWNRPEYPTGRVMDWQECRTGNVLFRSDMLADGGPAFLEVFGNGGEDKDFFMRMTDKGHVFRWCAEGIVHETVPRERWTRVYLLRRALLRGRNILKHPGQKGRLLAKSAVAVPLYTLALPFALLLGQHVFMKYCIRWCDHAGRLLGAVGLNPVNTR